MNESLGNKGNNQTPIERTPEGNYEMSTDLNKENVFITATELIELSDWCLLHMNQLQKDAADKK